MAEPKPTSRVRKNLDMDPRKLAAAQEILGTRTETETVDLALDYILTVSGEFAVLDEFAGATTDGRNGHDQHDVRR
ncbi:MAG TPA: hypothetical protein VIP11_00910 [Gemmatimonadaceae bacterium]